MHELTVDSPQLSSVRSALALCASDLPSGRIDRGRLVAACGPIAFLRDGRYRDNDGYETRAVAGGYEVRSARPRAFLSALLNLAAKLRGDTCAPQAVIPHFTSRLYKHEANIVGPGAGQHAWVGDLDEDFWVAYVKALVRLHFTGLVFYAHYHPFECFLDYDRFPEAPSIGARRRAATLAGLKRAFGVARAFGLETFIQHYITHFPEGLAKARNLPFRSTKLGSRLSALDHPVVDAYSRYIYRRTFDVLPELSGLYVNFESAPNSCAFVRRNLFPEIARAAHGPTLVFRLWDFNSPLAMKRLLGECPTRLRLAHKVQDRADMYYYPRSDPRVIEWKKQLGDVEWMFLVGPCHNCATAQSRKLWSDAGFVQSLLADAREKGADSFAFHTVYELLAPDIPAGRVANASEIEKALLNRGHLDAAVDYVRGIRTNSAARAARLSDRLGIDAHHAHLADRAIAHASQISLLTFQQHFVTSSEEAYLYPERRSFYQDPFLYPTMRFPNDEPWAAMTLTTAWLNRNLKLRNVADDVQPVIDFANPDKPRAPRSPAVIARLLKRHSEVALALARQAAGPSPSGAVARLVSSAREMANWGMRVHHETLVAADLYGVFFSRSRAKSIRLLRSAIARLSAAARYMRTGDPVSARRIPLTQEAAPEADLRRLRRLLRHLETGDFPCAAFAAFAASLERHNEIRRTVRPNKVSRPGETALIRARLKESVSHARASVGFLCAPRHWRLKRNVESWLSYIEAELAGVRPPSMTVPREADVARDEGFVPLVHDQCFRYAENCIDDLDRFFSGREWAPELDAHFRITYSRRGLVLSLLERNVDAAQRVKGWELYRGTRGATFFWRLYVDRECTGRKLDVWSVLAPGDKVLKGSFEIIDRQNTVLGTGQPVECGPGKLTHGRDWWRIDFTIPWRLLGGPAKRGEKWRVNVTAMPGCGAPLLPSDNIGRNRQVIWCRGWEFTAANDFMAGKPERMGIVTFR